MNEDQDAKRVPEPAEAGVQSPCVKLCVVDPNGCCQGCYRTLDEIAAWAAAPNQRRQEIVEASLSRKRAILGEGAYHATDVWYQCIGFTLKPMTIQLG